jgi:hypothetical protein
MCSDLKLDIISLLSTANLQKNHINSDEDKHYTKIVDLD